MSEFGSWRGHERFHHHHHHFVPPWALDQGDFGPPAPVAPMADMDDFGCDPNTPGFRVFGQDDDDQSAPQDDDQGGQGGVLDAVAQVAQGIPDVILPPAPPAAYATPSAPYYRHRRHHYHVPEVLYIDPRFDPHDRRWDAYAWGRLSRWDQDRYRRLWAERARHFHGEEELLHQASKGTFGQWPAQNFAQVPQSPNFRYGPGGYRPRGHHHHHHPRGGAMGPQGGYPGMPQGGYPGMPQGGYPGMPQGGWQGITPGTGPMPTGAPGMQYGLPPGSYQQTCNTCNYDGQTLRCTCKDMSGNWQHTSLVTDPTGAGQGISNHNGQLVIGAY
jgi:hypothetical protein